MGQKLKAYSWLLLWPNYFYCVKPLVTRYAAKAINNDLNWLGQLSYFASIRNVAGEPARPWILWQSLKKQTGKADDCLRSGESRVERRGVSYSSLDRASSWVSQKHQRQVIPRHWCFGTEWKREDIKDEWKLSWRNITEKICHLLMNTQQCTWWDVCFHVKNILYTHYIIVIQFVSHLVFSWDWG